MDKAGETPRGEHAALVLTGKRNFTIDSLIGAAFDPYLPEFGKLLPGLLAAYDGLSADDPRKARLAEPVAALRVWDRRWGASSTATSLAVFWGEALEAKSPVAKSDDEVGLRRFIENEATDAEQVDALDGAVARLTANFGDWRTPWGAINRFQRITDAIHPMFDDAGPSIPVPFVSTDWGSLAVFETKPTPTTRMRYGVSGNSFLAAVEFGGRVRARAVSIGGESGDPASKHFDDQADRYVRGDFRAVYFYPEDLKGHIERVYHPGS